MDILVDNHTYLPKSIEQTNEFNSKSLLLDTGIERKRSREL